MKILDANVHLTSDGKWPHSAKRADAKSLLNEMKQSKVSKALILPLSGMMTNKEVSALVRKNPDQFIAGASFNPGLYPDIKKTRTAFDSEFSNTDHKIIKFHTRFGKYSPTDERFMSVLKLNDARKQPIPIAVCGIFFDRHAEMDIAPPLYVFQLARKFPNTKFLIMHGTGTWIMKTAETVRDLKNIYLDLSFTISKYKVSSLAADMNWLFNNFDRRIIWGSDFPEYSMKDSLKDFSDIAGKLSSKKTEHILGKNLMELLGHE